MRSPAFDPGQASPLVASYLRSLVGPGPPLISWIDSADEMYGFHLHSLRGSAEAAALLYFLQGHQIAWTAGEVARWRFGAESAVPSCLDFAAGFGRATRFLARRLGPDRIWAAEIDPEAVAFQREVLGVHGVLSGGEAEEFDPGRTFDLILAISFFSHQPRRRFELWLERLYALLEPGGLLLMSVHGPALLSDPDADWSDGMVFRPESETRRLEPEQYGTSWITEACVREIVRGACGMAVRVSAFPFGLCGHQDLYVLERPPLLILPPLALPRHPRGALEEFEVRPDRVAAAGWAQGDHDEAPPRVRLLVGPSVLGHSEGEGQVGAKRRWSFAFPRDQASPDAVIRIEAESEKGLSSILAMGTLRPHLPGGSLAGRAGAA